MHIDVYGLLIALGGYAMCARYFVGQVTDNGTSKPES